VERGRPVGAGPSRSAGWAASARSRRWSGAWGAAGRSRGRPRKLPVGTYEVVLRSPLDGAIVHRATVTIVAGETVTVR
jgi:hypothetical protein